MSNSFLLSDVSDGSLHQFGWRCDLAWWVIVVYISMTLSQAMEEHRMRQVKIVEALEAEKKKISTELEEIQRRRAMRQNQSSRNG